MTPDSLEGGVMSGAISNIEGSNSLADLAARIKTEHTAVSALKDNVRHVIAIGELLIEQ